MPALQQLPIEIQLAIGGLLDYQSLRRLSSTTMRFRRLFRDECKEVLNNVIFDVEDGLEAVNSIVVDGRQKALLPCYGCHRFLTKLYYTIDQQKMICTRKGKHAFGRRCVTCQCKASNGRFNFTGPSRIVTGFPGLRVYCAGCKYIIRMCRCDCGAFDHQSHLPSDGPKSKVPRNFRCYYCCERVKWKRERRAEGWEEEDADSNGSEGSRYR